MAKADIPIVFFDPEALKIKNRTPISPQEIIDAMGRSDLIVFNHPDDLNEFLLEQEYEDTVLLMMSSGNYGGLDWEQLKARLVQF